MHACMQDCSTDVRTQQWTSWSLEVQYQFLRALFPSTAARVTYSVSDECLIPSILSFYGLSGPTWQTLGAPRPPSPLPAPSSPLYVWCESVWRLCLLCIRGYVCSARHACMIRVRPRVCTRVHACVHALLQYRFLGSCVTRGVHANTTVIVRLRCSFAAYVAGSSSHVDWRRQTNGHPGTYSHLMLQKGADVVRRVRLCLPAFSFTPLHVTDGDSPQHDCYGNL